ncbi:MAG: hypothetical protein ACTS6P_00465 [Candidatus Hodgkinia cicadicola]
MKCNWSKWHNWFAREMFKSKSIDQTMGTFSILMLKHFVKCDGAQPFFGVLKLTLQHIPKITNSTEV